MQSSKFGNVFMWLTKLAWDNKLTLPTLITCAFMALNFRWEIEINIHTERIVFQEEAEAGSDDISEAETWESISDDDDDDMPDGLPIDFEYSI